MNMLGYYRLIDDTSLEHFLQLDGAGLVDHVETLNDQEEVISYSVGDLWDALHFLLTSSSAYEYIHGNKLSEAIVGVHFFDCADFISCTEYTELSKIIAAMEQVDTAVLKETFNIEALITHNIYPDNWIEKDNKILWKDLQDRFKNLLVFYKKALQLKKHVVISIY